jgi:hypothetical protein
VLVRYFPGFTKQNRHWLQRYTPLAGSGSNAVLSHRGQKNAPCGWEVKRVVKVAVTAIGPGANSED